VIPAPPTKPTHGRIDEVGEDSNGIDRIVHIESPDIQQARCFEGPAERDWRPADYVDGLIALGFLLFAGAPGRWWECEPLRTTPEQRLEEMAVRSALAAVPQRRRAIHCELVRRGLAMPA
jgi:hypothetical protein